MRPTTWYPTDTPVGGIGGVVKRDAGGPAPRLLDLYCHAGGAAMGYHQAGFEVIGVDIEPQPNYPFEFHQANALEFDLRGYDAIHASPPCQQFTKLGRVPAEVRRRHPNLLWPTRFRLQQIGVPYVIENVPGAPLEHPYLLCGASVGLDVVRHRLFESNVFLFLPTCAHERGGTRTGRYVGFRRGRHPDGWKPPRAGEAQWRAACEVPWMTTREARQAIPPRMTQLIGEQLLAHLPARCG